MEKKYSPDLPSFYTVIPAFVRYDRNLSNFDKLLYGEIVALTNANNYCWATNKYFAKVFAKSERTIKYCLARLIKQGHIISTVKPENGNERILTLNMTSAKNGLTPSAKNCPSRARPKSNKKNTTRLNTLDVNTDWFDDYLRENELEAQKEKTR